MTAVQIRYMYSLRQVGARGGNVGESPAIGHESLKYCWAAWRGTIRLASTSIHQQRSTLLQVAKQGTMITWLGWTSSRKREAKMCVNRFAPGLVSRLSRQLAFTVLVFALSACGATEAGPTQTITTKSPIPTATSRSVPAATVIPSVVPSTVSWKTYRDDRAGYTIDYPATWRVDERVDSDDTDVTTFSPDADKNGMSVVVTVRNGAPAIGEIPDIPNMRCQQVRVGGLLGRRCFDTIASSLTSTLAGQGKQYAIVASGKHLDQNIYQHLVESFTVAP